MTNFTYNNHLQYTVGNNKFGYRTTPIEKYNVTLGSVDQDLYRTSCYHDELLRIADLVNKDFGKDLVVFLSGGTDSEIVIRNFLDIGIKPRCVTLKFKDGYNNDDVSEAEAIAKELDLKLEIINFDVKDFYYSGQAEEFGQALQCTQITYLMVYYNILKLGVPAVMGGEVLLSKSISLNDSFWHYTFRENEDASAIRFSNKFNIPLVNEWFSYTPEVLLYYLECPQIQQLVTTTNNFKLSSVSSKNDILRSYLPAVRAKKKTHGFEKLLAFNNEVYRVLTSQQIRRLESSLDGIPYHQAISQLKGSYEY
jgi:hypothetical protein